MVLQDHFPPPLSVCRHWQAFHNAWATYIASDLNAKLPEGYFAEPNVQFGIEIDVAAFEESLPELDNPETVIRLPIDFPNNWLPPPAQTVPFLSTAQTMQVSIFNTEAGPVLAGAIELVSPANKDRSTHRDAFVSKCETYLCQGIGLVIVDVVTGRKANLHNELLVRLARGSASPFDADLYATAYRPIERDGKQCLDIWQEKLAVGCALPTLPLWLRGDICLAVELNNIYDRTCPKHRIAVTSA
jgi:hypothetical protein